MSHRAQPCRHAVGDRCFVDETYVKFTGNQHGQVVDVYVPSRRDIAAAQGFFTGALTAHGEPDEVMTDLAQALETVIEELIPEAFATPTCTPTTALSAITAD